MTDLALREATFADAELLLEWRNDPVARENSFDQGAVDLETHRKWLEGKLAARDRTRIWILTVNGVPAGMVRYDRMGEAAQVSVAIDARFRGAGLGASILRLSAPRACAELGVEALRALVKPSNEASRISFERAGFTAAGTSADGALVFVWPISSRP
jgi:RimJ/RimL family protein N-acetyltransferase